MPRHVRIAMLVSLVVGVAVALAVPALGSDGGLGPLARGAPGTKSARTSSRSRRRRTARSWWPTVSATASCSSRTRARSRAASPPPTRVASPSSPADTSCPSPGAWAHRRHGDDAGHVHRAGSLRRRAGRRHGADRRRGERPDPPLPDRRRRAPGMGCEPCGRPRARDGPQRHRLRRRRGQPAHRDVRRGRRGHRRLASPDPHGVAVGPDGTVYVATDHSGEARSGSARPARRPGPSAASPSRWPWRSTAAERSRWPITRRIGCRRSATPSRCRRRAWSRLHRPRRRLDRRRRLRRRPT